MNNLIDISTEEHRLAVRRRREEALRQLLARDGVSSTAIVEELKKDLGVSRATAYRMMRTFRACGAVVAPSTRPVGRPKGARVLDMQREQLIAEAIADFRATSPRPRFNDLVQDVSRRCQAETLPAPNWRTIRARLRDAEARVAAAN